MTTPEKCEAILKKILEISNEDKNAYPVGQSVGFGPDWGGNALTVFVGDQHTHVGYPGASFDDLVDSLHRLLIDKTGLSWA